MDPNRAPTLFDIWIDCYDSEYLTVITVNFTVITVKLTVEIDRYNSERSLL